MATSAPQAFEFTKRKRWADILHSELSVDVLIFILSPACKVLYASPALKNLLGWKETEVVDRDFCTALVHPEDQSRFQRNFSISLQRGNSEDMESYVRLLGKPPSAYKAPVEMLFEIRGYPHVLPEENGEEECKCFFAVGKPWPNGNVALLNTFTELKMENTILEQRVEQLRPLVSSPTNIASPSAGDFGMTAKPPAMYTTNIMSRYHDPDDLLSPAGSVHGYRDAHDIAPNTNAAPYGGGSAYSKQEDDDEEGARKKKLKKIPASEQQQYVCMTCGRTDSPEWRKGPNGPKTLCNACGLRWAKQSRTQSQSHTQRPGEVLTTEVS